MLTDRIQQRLDAWKRQLIDLSRRNRLLNYRPTKATTVEIVDEVPHLVLGHLLAGETFEFDPRPQREGEDQDPSNDGARRRSAPPSSPRAGGAGQERDLSTGRTLDTTNGSAPADYHTDDRLQTAMPKERLDSNLLAIHRAADSSIEEQGVNTLFLALGMLEWRDNGDSGEVSRAPLIMVPVQLRRETAASPFVLSIGDEEPLLNPAIVEKLRIDFRLQLPELPSMTEDLDLAAVFEGIREAVSGFETWRLTGDIALGLFSFQKFIMYRDLERHEGLLREQPVIQAVCKVGDTSVTAVLPENVAGADLDEEMAPWASIQVMDADSSQQQAILAVRKENNLVIEGPPGTGKSQTITNLIADSLYEGKTVLFVAEKMAALDVVKSRLEHDAGLSDYVLELHSNKAAKRSFVESLARAGPHGAQQRQPRGRPR